MTINVTPVDDTFTDDNETRTTPEDTSINGNLLDNTTPNPTGDGNVQVTTFTVAGDPAVHNADGSPVSITGIGTIYISADGAYTFDPAANYNGPVPVITYTLSDGVGATDTSTLTINVTPVNDGPAITGGEGTVYESGIDGIGFNETANTEFAHGTFTISDPADGLSDIKSVTINGTTIAIGSLAGTEIDGDYGTLKVTSYDSSTGVAEYTYELTKPFDTTPDADNGNNIENNVENFTLEVSDGLETASASLTFSIVDDIPTAYSQEHLVEVPVPAEHALISNLEMGWTEPFHANVDTKVNSDLDPYYEKITWGDGGSSSNYIFTDNAALSTVNIDQIFTLGTFTHNNFPIPSGTSITQAYLKVNFDVTVNGQTVTVDHTVEFQHNETPNDGSHPDDIVTIVNGTDQVNVTVDGYTYTLKIGFQDANGNTVTSVDTAENASTTFNLNAILTASMDNLPVAVGTIDADFGADGPADVMVVSISHDADGDGTPEVYDASSPDYDAATTTLTITTQEGGQFEINFSTGDYKYTPPTLLTSEVTEVFTYKIVDADGDTAESTLTMNVPVSPADLTVASAMDDNATSDAPYVYGDGGPGIIDGTSGNNIMIADPWPNSNVTPGDILSLVLVLDSSGSMDSKITFNGVTMTRMEALKISVKQMLDGLAGSQASKVTVTLVDFDRTATNLGTFVIQGGTNDAAQLTAAKSQVDTLSAYGGTNYEAGLQTALDWIKTTAADDDATIKKVLFVSDGNPTYYLNSSGGVGGTGYEDSTNINTSMNQVLGSDGTNEVTLIEGTGYTIESVGIAITNADSIERLNNIEDGSASGGDGHADIITTGEALSQVIGELSGATSTKVLGSDEIHSGDGNDIIFGDVPFTDALADEQGLGSTIADGSGWKVFQELGWTEQQMVDYIKANQSTLSTESGLTGGNDTIDAGSGNDIVYGQDGNDIINGGAGDDILSGGTGHNTLTGGTGADMFILSNGGHDTITDYSKLQGDKVDISHVLDESAGDHLNVINDGSGHVKLEVLNSSGVEKASVTFENINFSELTGGDELNSLLGKVDIDHN
ncbi:MAG TPA: choice-of-anchor K domain-containing protein [Smithella sp.]|nr:choice-of-anchor K domain-containing protein [Smithella sp.]